MSEIVKINSNARKIGRLDRIGDNLYHPTKISSVNQKRILSKPLVDIAKELVIASGARYVQDNRRGVTGRGIMVYNHLERLPQLNHNGVTISFSYLVPTDSI